MEIFLAAVGATLLILFAYFNIRSMCKTKKANRLLLVECNPAAYVKQMEQQLAAFKSKKGNRYATILTIQAATGYNYLGQSKKAYKKLQAMEPDELPMRLKARYFCDLLLACVNTDCIDQVRTIMEERDALFDIMRKSPKMRPLVELRTAQAAYVDNRVEQARQTLIEVGNDQSHTMYQLEAEYFIALIDWHSGKTEKAREVFHKLSDLEHDSYIKQGSRSMLQG